jgi:hypothetical protein
MAFEPAHGVFLDRFFMILSWQNLVSCFIPGSVSVNP